MKDQLNEIKSEPETVQNKSLSERKGKFASLLDNISRNTCTGHSGTVEDDPSGSKMAVGLADRYAEEAVKADRYDPAALVNKGNLLLTRGDIEKASECYRESIQSDASCVEALYNLALAHKRLGRYGVALQCFSKLNVVMRNDPQVRPIPPPPPTRTHTVSIYLSAGQVV